MKFKEIYNQKSSQELVAVLEKPQDYQNEVIQIVKDILKERSEDQDQYKSMAAELKREEIRIILDELDPVNDKLELPFSHFLSEEDLKAILKEEFEQMMRLREGFKIDVWQYALGGI